MNIIVLPTVLSNIGYLIAGTQEGTEGPQVLIMRADASGDLNHKCY